MISQYWVGQIPANPIVLEIKNDEGEAVNLSSYTSFEVEILNENNDFVDLSGGTLESYASIGRFVWHFPTTSIFDLPGEYLLRLKMQKTGALDYTSGYTLYVDEFGGNENVYYTRAS